MRSFLAFLKKELFECTRTGKLLLFTIIFVLFGIMNPAVAKLTPWLVEMMSDSLAQSGMNITAVEVTALDSWVQFFKNIPMALIIYVIAFSGIFTKEYSSGTLILVFTKGMRRYKVLLAKALALVFLWTAGYFFCFGITYVYNSYYWDNSIAKNLFFAAVCWYLFSLFVICLLVFFSTLSSSNVGPLLGVGGIVFALYLSSIIPKLKEFLPTTLADGNSLIYGTAKVDDYIFALCITFAISIFSLALSLPIFNKKQL